MPMRQVFVGWLVALVGVFGVLAAGARAQDAVPPPAPVPPAESTPAPIEPPAAAPAVSPAPSPILVPTVPAYRQARNVAIITIKGEIDAGGRFGNSIMVASVRRRIATAVKSGADAIVFEIDSPGGEVGATLRIAEIIKECPVKNTVAWVRPQALSGGAFIALSCREIIVGDAASFGDAMPVDFGRGGMKSIDPELLKKVLPVLISSVVDSTRRHNDALGAYVRDEYLTQAIVANDVSLWWVRNSATGQEMAIDQREFEMLFPGVDSNTPTRLASIKSLSPSSTAMPPRPTESLAPTDSLPGAPAGSEKLAIARREAEAQQALGSPVLSRATARPVLTPADVGKWTLIDRVTDGSAPATFSALDMAHYNLIANGEKGADGRVVIRAVKNDSDVKAFFGAEHVRRLDSSWSEGLVGFLANPLVRGLFIAAFIICLFVEISHPGASLPGVLAVGALIMAIAPSMMMGMASWWEVGAIAAGVLLLGIEVFVLPGFGVPGILGLILLFAGLLGTFLPAGSSLFPKDSEDQSRVLWAIASILAAVLTSGIAIYFIARHLRTVPILNRFVLRDPGTDEASMEWASTNMVDQDAPARVGEVGVALTPMKPGGKVEIDGRVVDAVAEIGWITRGQRVKVVSVSGMRVGVEAV